MAAALMLGERGVGVTGNNPCVGCVIVKDGHIIGRGWTQAGGRPHAEGVALAQAGKSAAGSTIYITLEPCAHQSDRGPACSDLLLAAKPARVVLACDDPDPRTSGKGRALLQQAGIEVTTGALAAQARASMAGFFSRIERGRPFVTLKLATSLDAMIALPDGSSRWITSGPARAHAHLERARHDSILVGAGTVRMDNPALNVRLAGLEMRSPRRVMLGRSPAPHGWEEIGTPHDITKLDCNSLLVEGGAQTAAAFLHAGLIDRLIFYRAPILIGAGKACLADIGLHNLANAHDIWRLTDTRMLGKDRLEVYAKIDPSS